MYAFNISAPSSVYLGRSPVAVENERETVEEQKNLYKCSVCAQTFDKIFNLNKHLKAAHPDQFQQQHQEEAKWNKVQNKICATVLPAL